MIVQRPNEVELTPVGDVLKEFWGASMLVQEFSIGAQDLPAALNGVF